LKKAKLSRLNALIDDEPLPPTVPDEQNNANILANATNVSEMVANMKRQIEERKKLLSLLFIFISFHFLISSMAHCITHCETIN